MSIFDYNTTPSQNKRISGIDISEGCNAANINDAIRQMMADIASGIAGGGLVPTGTRLDFAGPTAPAGYVLEDGSAYSRTDPTYAPLFAVISTRYGAGDGSTTFNVPDSRGRVTVGSGHGSGLTNRTLAATGGEETHALSIAEAPANIPLSGTMGSAGGHTHTATDSGHTHPAAGAGLSGVFDTTQSGDVIWQTAGGVYKRSTIPANSGSGTANVTVSTVGDHTHTLTSVTANGGGTAHNNMQPYLVATKIIKL